MLRYLIASFALAAAMIAAAPVLPDGSPSLVGMQWQQAASEALGAPVRQPVDAVGEGWR